MDAQERKYRRWTIVVVAFAVIGAIAVVVYLVNRPEDREERQPLAISFDEAASTYGDPIAFDSAYLASSEGNIDTARHYTATRVEVIVRKTQPATHRFGPHLTATVTSVSGATMQCEMGRTYLWSDNSQSLSIYCGESFVPFEELSDWASVSLVASPY
ncbi:hypothetical protein ACI7YT_09025 [Microbacterium sp. M]|uniref:hypothetical protein n=1 Tax=Microbacterium sp. M TaxID=3377125 RepID=UPI003869EE5E